MLLVSPVSPHKYTRCRSLRCHQVDACPLKWLPICVWFRCICDTCINLHHHHILATFDRPAAANPTEPDHPTISSRRPDPTRPDPTCVSAVVSCPIATRLGILTPPFNFPTTHSLDYILYTSTPPPITIRCHSVSSLVVHGLVLPPHSSINHEI